jgi:hypothetical protein
MSPIPDRSAVMHKRNRWTAIALALVVGACSAATPPSEPTAQPTRVAPAVPTPAPTTPPPAADAQPADSASTVDYSCTTDAECAVKNVGNCCGYYPACVNVDSPTFPEQVKAECERTGTSSICGFPVIERCQCVAGRCEPDGAGALQKD